MLTTVAVLALSATAGVAAEAAAARQADLAAFRDRFMAVDRSYSAAARAEAESRLAKLEAGAATLGPAAFELELARIVALADNGHTVAFAGPRARRYNRVAIRLEPFGEDFFVLRATPAHADLIGTRLVAIDGSSIADLRNAARSLAGGLPAWRDRSAGFLFESPEQLHALGLARQADAATYRFAPADGTTIERRIEAAAEADRSHANADRWLYPESMPAEGAGWRGLLAAEQAPWVWQEPGAPFRWRRAPEIEALVIQLRQNHGDDRHPIDRFLRDMTRLLREEKPRHLVLDMRLNSGGDLNTTRDFMQSLPALVPGRLFALISPWTFSAAISSVGYLEQAAPERVTLVGEPVGDRMQFWAEGRPFALPNSGIFIALATQRHDYLTGCRPFTDCHDAVVRHAIAVPDLSPDVAAPWTLEAYRAGRDPGMEAIAAALGRSDPLSRTERNAFAVGPAPAGATDNPSPQAASADSALPPLGARLDQWLKAAGFQGVVLVARDGEVILRQGYGLADRERSIPWSPDSVFTVGSITKQFTAAAILKLEMQGRLKVGDPIAKYLPDVPEDKRGITLHHLLTHTAGLDSDFAGDYESVAREEYVRRALASTPRSKPGEAYHYSNAGYSLLGAIVERVTGRSYDAWLRESLFLPAGMKETGYRLPAWEPSRLVVGYRADERWGKSTEKPWAEDGPWWALRANGGILSTIDDLYRWDRVLRGDTILSAAARESMLTRHVREGAAADTFYGYGWALGDTPWGGGRYAAHNGGNGIFFADFARALDEDLVVILSTNDSRMRVGRYTELLGRLVRGETVPVVAAVPSSGSLRPLGTDGLEAVARAWFDAYNAEGPEAMRAFRTAHAQPRPGTDDAERERGLARMRADLGRMEPMGVAAGAEEGITVRAKCSRVASVSLRFIFTPAGKLEAIAVEADP